MVTLPKTVGIETVTISGTATVGQTLTAAYNNTYTGNTPTYAWYRGATKIDSATQATYTLGYADGGQAVKCVSPAAMAT